MSLGVPIAVIGMACRFPGAESPAALLDVLRTGGTCVGPASPERRALWGDGFAEPPAVGLLEGIDCFDRHPFRISATEAPLLDPQQRLVLEMAWHALEDAGLSPTSMNGTPTGVYVGAGSSDHAIRMAQTGMLHQNPHLPNAVQNAAISGRVSYCLGLTGPSMTLDTACSSALASVTLAGDALRLGQCDLALAGGVNALLAPVGFTALQTTGVLSGTGQTRSFDAAANGFVRSEGCGMLALKRLPDALTDQDRIHAILPGWATGQDGRSNGLSAPSPAAQSAVIKRALRAAGIAPDAVGAVEAHGSATVLGDAIEAGALADVFANRTSPLAALGSIKAALGHLEAAAGIAGLIKAILMVRDGFIPMQPQFDEPSPRVAWDSLPFTVPRVTTDWPDARRVAGVSAFGMSGLNAHMIVTSTAHASAPDYPKRTTAIAPQMFLLSAASPAALATRASQLRTVLDTPTASLPALASAVSRRWTGMNLRAGFLANSLQEARAAAERIAVDPPASPVRLPGKVFVQTPQPLQPADRAVLQAACTNLTYVSEIGAIAVKAQHADIPSVLLALHLAGATLNPQAFAPAAHDAPDLPGYPFDRQRCWYENLPL